MIMNYHVYKQGRVIMNYHVYKQGRVKPDAVKDKCYSKKSLYLQSCIIVCIILVLSYRI